MSWFCAQRLGSVTELSQILGLGLVAILLGSEAAHAHASDRLFILTLPTNYYYASGALAIVATFVVTVWLGSRLSASPKRLFSLPYNVPVVAASWISWTALVALLLIGFYGNRDPFENLLVLVVWTIIWVGVTTLSVLFGNVWAVLNPWIGPVRLVRALIGRERTGGLDRLGYWPAVLGFLGFAWFEIVSLAPDDPEILARAVLLYWSIVFVLAVHSGEEWLHKGEFFTVLFGLFARIAPFWLERQDGQSWLMLGLPGTRLARHDPLPISGIAFVTLVLTTLSFDGLSETFWWLAAIGINPLAFPGRSAVVGVNTAGLLGLWGVTGSTILAAIYIAAESQRFWKTAGRVILSFLPIAAGYHIAHYLVALLTNGQYALQAFSDPFSQGWNLLGLKQHFVSTSFMNDYHGMLLIWNVQAFYIVIGHVIAIVLAFHLAAAAREGGTEGRTRTSSTMRDVPMTVLMVFYTVFGLWLLSTPTGA